MSTVAVDFDGVIHRYSRGWADGSIYDRPIDGAFNALRSLMRDHAVFVHTTRKPSQVARWIERQTGYDIEPAHGWLAMPPWRKFWNELGILLVTNRKLPAIAYVDDRAIRFRSWDQVLADLADPEAARRHADMVDVAQGRLPDEVASVLVDQVDAEREADVRAQIVDSLRDEEWKIRLSDGVGSSAFATIQRAIQIASREAAP